MHEITEELIEKLRATFSYDSESGILSAKKLSDDYFADSPGKPANIKAKTYNTRWSGRPAGFANGNGYLRVCVCGKRLYAHRVIWAMLFGKFSGEIDHQNGIRSDNRLVNLRNVSTSENAMNRSLRKTNAVGCQGVYHRNGKWSVAIFSERAGTFNTKEEAIGKRKQLEKQYGFHPNHGSAQPTQILKKSDWCQGGF